MAIRVKETSPRQRIKWRTRISSKNQITIPVEALRKSGLKAGDEVRVHDDGLGRVVLTKLTSAVDRHAGTLTGVYPKGYLKKLRAEWR